MMNSRIPSFHKIAFKRRLEIVAELCGLDCQEMALKMNCVNFSDSLIENVIGSFCVPMGVATNFVVNGRDYLVPMATEEKTIIAAASKAALIVRGEGGFVAQASDSIMIGQIQLFPCDMDTAICVLRENKRELIEYANSLESKLSARGGGVKDIEFLELSKQMIAAHIMIDVRDAMGAYMVTRICETLGRRIEKLADIRANLCIVSNLAEKRMARAECWIAPLALENNNFDVSGKEIAERIIQAQQFAELSPHRAATHNKGIQNGIVAVTLATGNDYRAVEAGAHSYAARSGSYQPLTKWSLDSQGRLYGKIELPLAVGVVGGIINSHPTANIALKIIGAQSSSELAQVMAAVGLAQNLGALLALVTTGVAKNKNLRKEVNND